MIVLMLIYNEIILWCLSGVGTPMSLLYHILFALSFGIALRAVSMAFGRAERIAGIVLAVSAALYYATACVIRSSFRVYFSPANMLSGGGDVAAHYTGELMRSVFAWIAVLVLCLLPLWLPYLWRRIIVKYRPGEAAHDKAKGSDGMVGEAKYAPDRSIGGAAVIFVLACFLHFLVGTMVDNGPYAGLRGTQYHFNTACETFGLSEATRLSFGGVTDAADKGFNVGNGFQMSAEKRMEAQNTDNNSQNAGNGSDAADGKAGDGSGNAAGNENSGNSGADAAAKEGLTGSDAANGSSEDSLTAETESKEPEPEAEPVYNVMELTFPEDAGADKLNAYVSALEPSLQNAYTGLFRGKNLIMICAESYCDAFIRPELTPTLWRLSHNGFCFPNYYQPSWGGSTTTGELSMVLGLDSTKGDDAFYSIGGNNHYFTMGNQLQRQGYFSLSFHNGYYNYYHRELTHTNIGYDAFIASGQHLEKLCGNIYPPDVPLFEKTMPLYLEHAPFSVYYMTLSGHAPYQRDSYFVGKYYKEVDAFFGDEYAEKTKYYICYQMELERALTSLVEELEKAGIADDTVIVMTGDHYPYGLGNGSAWGNDRDYIQDLIKGDDRLYWNEDKSGLIIWSGCLEHELKDKDCTITDPVMSLDILPTVSNLFGVEFDSRLLPGRDVFAENTEPLVFWNNLSWVTREGKYDTRKREYHPAEDTTIPEDRQEEYIKYISGIVDNRILMSSSIMKLDYYRMLFGDDTDGKDPEAVWASLQEEIKAREEGNAVGL